MPIDPRSSDSIFDDIESELVSSINKLTNFVSGTFNSTFLSAYSEQIREAEIKALAVQLSGYPEYAGKEVTQDDLDELGVTDVDPAEVNEYVKATDLDKLAELVGVTRESGVKATGTVTITTTDDQVTIPEGFTVATQPSGAQDPLRFLCDVNESGAIEDDGPNTDTVQPATGNTTVTVPVIAEFVGERFNVGAGSVTFIPSQLPGIISVSNPGQITGGVDVESTESLRKRTKNAVFTNSGGGTKQGVIGAVQNQTDFNATLAIRENLDQSPRVVELIADVQPDSAREQEIKDIVDRVRPVGVKHRVIPPTIHHTTVTTEVQGPNVDSVVVAEAVEGYIDEIAFGDIFTDSELTSQILSGADGVRSVETTNTAFTQIQSERFTYDGADTVRFDQSPFGTVTDETYRYQDGTDVYPLIFDDVNIGTERVVVLVNGVKRLLDRTAGEYSLTDTTGSGTVDAVTLDTSVVDPDDDSAIDISYRHNSFSVDSVSTPSQTFTDGVDYTVADTDSDGIPDGIQWLAGGQRPDVNDNVAVTYTTNSSLKSNYATEQEEKLTIDNDAVTVRELN